jgi:hypothetical protein
MGFALVGVAMGVDGRVLARVVWEGLSGLYVFVTLCAKGERGRGLAYRGG